MLDTVRKGALTVAGLGALALGGSAIAGAADDNNTSSSSQGTSSFSAQGAPGPGGAGPRPGGPPREPLSSENAAKVKAAAIDKVSGATVLRTEAGGPYGTPYHAHIRTSDGKRQVVLVDSEFKATAVQADRGPRGPGGPGRGGHHGGPGGREAALTGETRKKVEAAVLDKYSGATILRTEKNNDGSAPYESHIRTSDGKELEVLVSKDFEVVEARERPPRP